MGPAWQGLRGIRVPAAKLAVVVCLAKRAASRVRTALRVLLNVILIKSFCRSTINSSTDNEKTFSMQASKSGKATRELQPVMPMRTDHRQLVDTIQRFQAYLAKNVSWAAGKALKASHHDIET